MNAIVVNLLIGSFVFASFFNRPALANSPVQKKQGVPKPLTSAKLLIHHKLPFSLFNVNIAERIASRSKLKTVDVRSFELNSVKVETLSLKQQTFTYQNHREDLIFGVQNAFWSSQNQKYWGVTTIEHLGENRNEASPNLSRLNYTEEAPSLTPGSAVLTISGGGERNSEVRDINTSGKFEDFRGGVTYHQSLSNDVTVGVGFVYEDLVRGFSQFTYQSDLLPLRTTVSLLAGDRGLEMYSHIRLAPFNDFTINYYHERERQRFDLNWAMLSGLSFTAKGNSQYESLSAGLKIAVKNEYFSLLAKAELDNDQNWNWRINSRLGSLELFHAADRRKTQFEVNLNPLESLPNGFDCSLFLKYETRHLEGEINDLTVWGSRLNAKPDSNNRYLWQFDLGYGFGSQGSGAIASTSVSLTRNLSLKLIYEEVSALSDDTNIKLQLAQ